VIKESPIIYGPETIFNGNPPTQIPLLSPFGGRAEKKTKRKLIRFVLCRLIIHERTSTETVGAALHKLREIRS
jgi:hypothetical protein